jgi:hypothetical protein
MARDFDAEIGENADAIEKEVMGRCSPRTNPAIVKLAARDALKPREPRWFGVSDFTVGLRGCYREGQAAEFP